MDPDIGGGEDTGVFVLLASEDLDELAAVAARPPGASTHAFAWTHDLLLVEFGDARYRFTNP